jgi:hypothetical protein
MTPRTLIVTHEGADFDALASAVAARKLHPDATLLLPRSTGRELHAYLALHRELFSGVSAAETPWASIERLVLVDVRCASRLRHVAPLLQRQLLALLMTDSQLIDVAGFTVGTCVVPLRERHERRRASRRDHRERSRPAGSGEQRARHHAQPRPHRDAGDTCHGARSLPERVGRNRRMRDTGWSRHRGDLALGPERARRLG